MVAKKSSAILNNSQYSFFFNLSPNNLKSLKESTTKLIDLKNKILDSIELLEMLDEESDKELLQTIEEDNKTIKDDLKDLSIYLLFSKPYDKNNCIVEIHPGAGGTESCDWANMLYRMYTRYCEKKNFKIELLDYQAGEEAGLKSVSFKVKGEYAYGYLKNEKGVHRLVRLSPFDSSNRRHTSFASIDVTPEISKDIKIDINEKDLKIDVYRSTGAGGQGVNTTDSAVRITHLLTKIVVTCQNERSQIQNKETALQVLKSKLYVLEQQKKEQELAKEKGIQSNIDFGSQIRSYILHPYSLVKDHRTNYETSDTKSVLDGEIDKFIESNLKGGSYGNKT